MSTLVSQKKRTSLRNLAAMTESPNEKEILTAAGMLNRQLRGLNLTWDQVFGIEPGFHPTVTMKTSKPDRDEDYLEMAKRIRQSSRFPQLYDNARAFVGDVVDELKPFLSPKQRRWLFKLAKVARVPIDDLDSVLKDARENFGLEQRSAA